jgi:tRNA U38,U39,U40 pseudouridine synthase TruA
MSKQASRDDHLKIHALASAGLKNKQIAEQMGYSKQRVPYLRKAPVSPRKRKGRPPIFDEAKRQKLVNFVTASPENRQLEYFRFPPEVSVDACERIIRRALGTKDFHRYVQCQKPYLSKVNREKRLLFAECYEEWEVEDWYKVLFTDESFMQCLGKF